MFRSKKPVIVGSGLDRLTVSAIPRLRLQANEWKELINLGRVECGPVTVGISRARDVVSALGDDSDLVLFDTNHLTAAGQQILRFAAGAKSCATNPTEALLRAIPRFTEKHIPRRCELRADYVELYVDLQGTARPTGKMFDQFVCRARSREFKELWDKETCEGDPLQIIRLGKQGRRGNNIVTVYYEKPCLPGDDWRVAKWRLTPGFDASQTVRRLEFRLWGYSKMSVIGIDPHPTQLVEGGLNNLWTYLTKNFFRVAARPRRGRKRIPDHPFWSLVQNCLPLADKPLLPRYAWDPKEQELEVLMKRTAGHLRSFAGLTDSEEDVALAQAHIVDAALALLRDVRERDDHREAEFLHEVELQYFGEEA